MRAPAGRRQSKPPCGLARSRPGRQALLGKFADLRANATVGGDNAIPTCTRAFLHIHRRDEEVGARTWNTHVPGYQVLSEISRIEYGNDTQNNQINVYIHGTNKLRVTFEMSHHLIIHNFQALVINCLYTSSVPNLLKLNANY